MGKLIYLILLSAFALGGLGIARATAGPAAQGDAQRPAVTSTAESASRVYIDPKTRKLGGPPPGTKPPGLSIAEQNKLSRADTGLKKRLLPNGTSLVNLQGRFQNMSVVTMTPDGKTHMTCSHSVDDVEHALTHSGEDKP